MESGQSDLPRTGRTKSILAWLSSSLSAPTEEGTKKEEVLFAEREKVLHFLVAGGETSQLDSWSRLRPTDNPKTHSKGREETTERKEKRVSRA